MSISKIIESYRDAKIQKLEVLFQCAGCGEKQNKHVIISPTVLPEFTNYFASLPVWLSQATAHGLSTLHSREKITVCVLLHYNYAPYVLHAQQPLC